MIHKYSSLPHKMNVLDELHKLLLLNYLNTGLRLP